VTQQGVLLTNGRLTDGRRVDITLAGERIAGVTPVSGATGVDLGGGLVLPGLIDGHVHLDKTLLGLPWRPHAADNSTAGRIAHERAARPSLELPVRARAENLLARMAGHGTSALRTHVDIDETTGLANLHAVLDAVATVLDRMTVQIVAFPQSGISGRPGVADLLDAALREGADLIGGIDPNAIDGDPSGHLDTVFRLAERHGVGIDIHCHETGPTGNAVLRDIAARTAAAGLGGRVTVSHAFSLGADDARDVQSTADALAAAGVAILTAAPGAAPMPPVKRLRAAGVTVFAGSDNIRDLWSPFGNGDMLERAFLIAYRQGFRTDADIATAFELCTSEAARAMGLPEPAVAPGVLADLVVVPGVETLAEVIAERPGGRLIWQRGRPVRTSGD
jgi:cytosine deaminase